MSFLQCRTLRFFYVPSCIPPAFCPAFLLHSLSRCSSPAFLLHSSCVPPACHRAFSLRSPSVHSVSQKHVGEGCVFPSKQMLPHAAFHSAFQCVPPAFQLGLQCFPTACCLCRSAGVSAQKKNSHFGHGLRDAHPLPVRSVRYANWCGHFDPAVVSTVCDETP